MEKNYKDMIAVLLTSEFRGIWDLGSRIGSRNLCRPESRVPPEWVPTFESVALLSIDMDDVVIGTLNMFTGQRSCSMVVGYNTYGVDFRGISVGETGFVPIWFISSSKD